MTQFTTEELKKYFKGGRDYGTAMWDGFGKIDIEVCYRGIDAFNNSYEVIASSWVTAAAVYGKKAQEKYGTLPDWGEELKEVLIKSKNREVKSTFSQLRIDLNKEIREYEKETKKFWDEYWAEEE